MTSATDKVPGKTDKIVGKAERKSGSAQTLKKRSKRGKISLINPVPEPQTASWQSDDKRFKSLDDDGAAHPRPETNKLDDILRDTFNLKALIDDTPDLHTCKHCKKSIVHSNASSHIQMCLRAKKEKALRKKEAREARERAKEALNPNKKEDKDDDSGDDDDIPADKKDSAGKTTRKGAKRTGDDRAGKKRKADEEKGPKAKKKKEDTKAKTSKLKGPVDVERQCGVILPNGQPCARSLTCKSHSMGAKRGVAGRSLPYDMLLAAYQKKNQAKQQKAALDANAPLEDEEDNVVVDPDEEATAVMASLANWNPTPVVPQPVFEPIRREYGRSRLLEQLMQATNGGKNNIFKVVGYGAQVLPEGHPGLNNSNGMSGDGDLTAQSIKPKSVSAR